MVNYYYINRTLYIVGDAIAGLRVCLIYVMYSDYNKYVEVPYMTSSMTILTSLAIKVALNSSVVSMYAHFITIRNTTSVHDHHTLQRPFNWNTYIDRTGGLLLLPKKIVCVKTTFQYRFLV